MKNETWNCLAITYLLTNPLYYLISLISNECFFVLFFSFNSGASSCNWKCALGWEDIVRIPVMLLIIHVCLAKWHTILNLSIFVGHHISSALFLRAQVEAAIIQVSSKSRHTASESKMTQVLIFEPRVYLDSGVISNLHSSISVFFFFSCLRYNLTSDVRRVKLLATLW